jgi:pimeloyl-ACP methyl ester carboxylesterase
MLGHMDHIAPSPLAVEPAWIPGPLGKLAWYEDGTGEPVVLVHAIDAAASAMEIRPLFDAFRQRRRAIALDLPGFGRSDRPRERYRPHHMQDAIARVLEHASASGPVDVVALSLPGQYVVMEALARPERIRRLVLIGPTGAGRFAAKREGAWGHAVERWLQLPGIGSAIFGALRTRRSIDWYLDRTLVDPAAMPEEARRYAWRTAQAPGARWAPSAFLAGLLDVPGIERAYPRLPMPTLMVFGEDPRFSDPQAMGSVVAGTPTIRVERIPGTRDLPHWEAPHATLEAIQRFLDEGPG